MFNTVILLAAVLVTVNADILTRLVCEREKLVLECPRGYTIDVLTALYGKKNHLYCNMVGNKVNNCVAGNALDIVKFKCNRKQMCYIDANNQVFGDPCVGTRKYLEVTYECMGGEINTKTACEDDELEIKCSDGYYVWIANAYYGRTNPTICSKELKDSQSNKCGTEKALAVVETRCDNLEQCSVMASNSLFGDPCTGTYKYLEVDYQCLDLQQEEVGKLTLQNLTEHFNALIAAKDLAKKDDIKDLKGAIELLREENKNLKSLVENIQKENKYLETRIAVLENYNLGNNIVFKDLEQLNISDNNEPLLKETAYISE